MQRRAPDSLKILKPKETTQESVYPYIASAHTVEPLPSRFSHGDAISERTSPYTINLHIVIETSYTVTDLEEMDGVVAMLRDMDCAEANSAFVPPSSLFTQQSYVSMDIS